jgi:hypothetical protein
MMLLREAFVTLISLPQLTIDEPKETDDDEQLRGTSCKRVCPGNCQSA